MLCSTVGMFDRKQSGSIDFHEFQALWKYVTDWQKCFRSFDQDNSGSIDRRELKNALTTFGNLLRCWFMSFSIIIAVFCLSCMLLVCDVVHNCRLQVVGYIL